MLTAGLRLVRLVVRITGLAVSWILLTPAYVVLFVPGRLWLRWRGRDPLARRADPEARTYWSPHRPNADPDRYRHPFA